MRVSDLLNEVSAAEEFIVSGKPFKARVNPSKGKLNTWDLVLVNNKDDISIVAPEFFFYEPAKNDGEWNLTSVNDYWMGQSSPRTAQSKPFPGATLEKQIITTFCKALTAKKASALRVAEIEDPDNKLSESLTEGRAEQRLSNSTSILPAARAIFDKNKVSVEDINSEWKKAIAYVIKQGDKKAFLVSNGGDVGYAKGKKFNAHHDQTWKDLGEFEVVDVIKDLSSSDFKEKLPLYVFK